MSASRLASATTAEARPPADAMLATTASSAALVRPATMTFKPSAANRLHNCAPRPRSGPTPITTAVFIALSFPLTGPFAPSRSFQPPQEGDASFECQALQLAVI